MYFSRSCKLFTPGTSDSWHILFNTIRMRLYQDCRKIFTQGISEFWQILSRPSWISLNKAYFSRYSKVFKHGYPESWRSLTWQGVLPSMMPTFQDIARLLLPESEFLGEFSSFQSGLPCVAHTFQNIARFSCTES